MTCEVKNESSKPSRQDLAREVNVYENSVFFREVQPIVDSFESSVVLSSASASSITPFIELSKNVNTYIRTQIEWEANGVDSVEYFKTTYSSLYERMEPNPFITPVEIEQFSKEYFYFPSTTIPALSVGDNAYISNLNNYYRKQTFSQSGMGAFCALVPNIFGKIQAFFGAIQGFAEKLEGIINSIQNFTVAGLINRLQQQIVSVIDGIVSDIKNKLANIGFEFVNGSFNFNGEVIMKKVDKLKSEAQEFFADFNIKNLKDQIKGQIAYAVSIFENPSIEEIQFLIFRFCSLISSVEQILQGKLTPVNNLIGSYEINRNGLASAGGLARARAVAAGANRYTPDERIQRAGEARGIANREIGLEGVGPGQAGFRQPLRGRYIEITQEDAKNMVPWNDGNGVSGIIIFSEKLKTLPESEWKFNPWNEVEMRVRAYLSKTARQFGRQLTVTSGFRSIPYNNNLRSRGGGAAQNSLHTSGEAIDCTFSGLSDSQTRDNFLQIAFLNGFEWFKYYPEDNFIHIDVMDRPGSAGSLRSRFRGR